MSARRLDSQGRSARDLPLLAWLALMAAVLVAPAFGFTVHLMNRKAAIERKALETNVVQVAKDLAEDIDRDLTGIATTLKVLASMPELRRGAYQDFHARASETLRDSDMFVLFRDPTGQQLLNTRREWGTQLPLEILPEIDAAVRRSDQPYVSNLIIGAVARRPVYAISVAIRRDGQFLGTLTISLNPERLLRIAREQSLAEGWNTGVTDAQGLILARLVNHHENLGKQLPEPLRAASLANLDKAFEATSIEGKKILRAATRSELAPWIISANLPLDMAEASTKQAQNLLWLMGVLLALASLAISAALSRMLTRSIRAIERGSALLAGDREPQPIDTSVREVNAVGERLRTASKLLRARADELEAVNARFSIALRGAEIVVFTQDRERRYTWVGSGRDTLSPSALLGKREEDHLPAPAQAAVIPLKERTLETGEVSEGDYQVDGRHFRLRVEPMRDRGRVAGLIGVCLDITRERHSQERIRFLLEEVSHRSKNLLTLISSISAQTLRSAGSPEEFQKRFNERLQGLARSQELMLKEGAFACDLRLLVDAQLSAFGGVDGRRVRAVGPPVLLGPAATQNLGLVLHELATNATKYGALSKPEGSVSVEWALEPAKNGATPRFVMTWQERDGPTVAEPAHKGFGSVVITRLVETSMEATIELDHDPQGLVWRMIADPSRVLAASVPD